MHNTWLIARREYLERIRTRGFLITTVMIPLIMVGFIYGSALVNSKSHTEAHIAVVSSDPQLALDLQTALEQQGLQDAGAKPDKQTHITVDPMSPPAADARATRAILDQNLDSEDLDGYLWIAKPATPAPRMTTRALFTPGTPQTSTPPPPPGRMR